MARPFTKTQQALLAKARESRLQTISVETCTGRGPAGGKVGFGRREMDAAVALRDMGLLVELNVQRDRRSERGYGTISTIRVLRLVEGQGQ